MLMRALAILITISAGAHSGCACKAQTAPNPEKIARSYGVDLSTPEKAVGLYFEAFRVGDDSLLDKVLAPNAVISEFNPLQKIDAPDPSLIGPEIVEVRPADTKMKSAEPYYKTMHADVEVFVIVRYEEPWGGVNYVAPMIDQRIYLMRRFEEGWKILAELTFWPEEEQARIKKLDKGP